MIIERYKAKSLIRTSVPSLFSWAEAYLNPYQGCHHNCSYCDGKADNYHMHDDFADRIRVKINAPFLLEQYLQKRGFFPSRAKIASVTDFFPHLKIARPGRAGKFIFYVGGGVCDVYQPAEKDVKLTRKLLEIIYDYGFPVHILTKNKLVLEDLDLLKRINQDNYACVNFTITLADDKVQEVFEPGASPTSERFAAIKKLREEGIHSGVYFYPVLPFIGDTDDNMQAIYKQAKKAGAEFVYCWGLSLKPGRNKQEFMQTVQKHYPDLLTKYERLYGNNNKYGNLDYEQFKEMGLIWPEIKAFKLCHEFGLGYTAKRYVPAGRIQTNLQVAEMLWKISHVKANILQQSIFETRKINQAAYFIEKYRYNLSRVKIEELPVTKKVHPYIKEFLEENKSIYLENLEEEAYRSISH
ncbi:MAG: radical SAM protein [Candidatus Odinarchaeota archaeon]